MLSCSRPSSLLGDNISDPRSQYPITLPDTDCYFNIVAQEHKPCIVFSSVVVREAGKETCEMEGRIRFRLLLYSVKQWQDAIIEKAVLITQSQYGWADNGYAQKTVVSTRQQLPVVHTAGFSSDNNLKKSIATFKNHQMGVPYFDDATYENDTYIPFTVEDEYSIYTETNSIKAINRMYRADPKVKLWKNIYAYLERLNNF